METRIANFISIVFHPMLMPTLGVIILLNLDTYLSHTITPSGKFAVYSIVLINTGIVPALLVWLHLRFQLVKSLKLASRKERTLPFILTMFFYFFCYFILKRNHLPVPVYTLQLGASISVLLAILINFFWKISIHTVGMGGLAGMLLGISQKMNIEIISILLPFILMGGLVGFARLKLNAHTPLQVYSGFLLGLGSIWTVLAWY